MPGMALPIADGGIGFDYRLGMGLPDMWIKTVKEKSDEQWDIFQMWCEMCLRRPGENTIAYVESHDQALVGDQTMIFRLAGANMYTDMDKACHNPRIDRAIALHKMIRLFTLAGGGEGYLNFMGNEFGHPEWIDFPREGNGWSFHYCRRQWSLKDNGFLKYQWLGDFDQDMVALTKENRIFDQRMGDLLLNKQPEKALVFYRHGLLFAFNFHPSMSLTNVLVPVPQPGEYTVALSTDDEKYGGWNQVQHIAYPTKMFDGKHYVELYLPARTAVVLKERVILPEDVEKEAAPKKKPGRPRKNPEAPAEEKPKTTRKRTAKAAEAPAAVTEAPAAEEKKPARTSSAKKAPKEPKTAEKKPSTRKKTTKKAEEKA